MTAAKGVERRPSSDGRLSWGDAWRLSRLGGREESLRRALVVGCAALAVVPLYLAAGLPGTRGSWGYALAFIGDPGLWAGILLVLGLMALPAVHLAVLAARVGGPARDRRLAAMRAAGATSADVRRVMRAEALAWSVPGVVLGVGLGCLLWWLGSRVVRVPVAEDPWEPESPVLVHDVPLLPRVWPHPGLVLLAALVVLVLAALLAPLAVRRVSVGLEGQRVVERSLRARVPALLLVGAVSCGVGIFLLVQLPANAGPAVTALLVLGPLLLLAALVTAAPLVARALGRLLARGGPTRLLAGRSMVAHPMLAARASASLVLVGLGGGLLAAGGGLLESELTCMHHENGSDIRVDGALTWDGLFYLIPVWVGEGIVLVMSLLGLVGIVVAVAEHAVTRRRSAARLVAGGVPRRTVARAMVVEGALPAAVMGPLSLAAGLAIPTGWMLVVGGTDLVSVPWGYVLTLLGVLLLTPFVAAWAGSRWVGRTDDLRALRDR